MMIVYSTDEDAEEGGTFFVTMVRRLLSRAVTSLELLAMAYSFNLLDCTDIRASCRKHSGRGQRQFRPDHSNFNIMGPQS